MVEGSHGREARVNKLFHLAYHARVFHLRITWFQLERNNPLSFYRFSISTKRNPSKCDKDVIKHIRIKVQTMNQLSIEWNKMRTFHFKITRTLHWKGLKYILNRLSMVHTQTRLWCATKRAYKWRNYSVRGISSGVWKVLYTD